MSVAQQQYTIKSMKNLLAFLILILLEASGSIASRGCPMNVPLPPAISVDLQCTAEPTDCRTNTKKLKYRTLDGTCNNLDHPMWGAGYYRFARMMTPNYADGIYSMPLSREHHNLPSPRKLSLELFGRESVPDAKLTLAHMQFGQYLAHDLGSQIDKSEESEFCCAGNGTWNYCDPLLRTCASIKVFRSDPYFPPDIKCMNFIRSVTDRDILCDSGPPPSAYYEQINSANGYIDHSPTYGPSLADLNRVRLYVDGLLISTVANDNKTFPGISLAQSNCAFDNEACYEFGDNRANTNPGLFILQTFFYREHNAIARQLKLQNPHWDDDMLFETARKINIAVLQHIAYDEYLPALLDQQTLQDKKIVKPSSASGYVNDYDPFKVAGTFNEFTTGAFRFFHSQIEGHLTLLNISRMDNGALRYSDCLERPGCLFANNGTVYDEAAIGLSKQPSQKSDTNFDSEIREFLFKRSDPFGLDLRSIDIIRARDHGLPTYNDMRTHCGLVRITSWLNLVSVMPERFVHKLKHLYDDVDDVELVVGGALENHIPGSNVGPTFSCILAHQFNFAREGDRFFYENADTQFGCHFTSEQIAQIKRVKMAKIFCNNLPQLAQVQGRVFEQPSTANPLVNCSALGYIDFSKWKNYSC